MNILDTEKEILNIDIRIAVRKTKDDCVLTRPSEFDGLEEYIAIIINNDDMCGTHAIEKDEVYVFGNLGEKGLWEQAEKNTREHFTISNLGEKIAMMLGTTFSEFSKIFESQIYIIGNTNDYLGAGSIVCKDMIREFCEKKGMSKIIVMPSSIHEMLFIPYGDLSVEETTELVASINETDVDEYERLTDRSYVMEF